MKTTQTINAVSDRLWEKLSGQKINRAAQRRTEARERAEAIQKLGWVPEDPHNRYAATTGELVKWASENRPAHALGHE